MRAPGWSPTVERLWFPFLNWPKTIVPDVKIYEECDCEVLRQLAEAEWNDTVHPTSDFTVKLDFDSRAIVGGDRGAWPMRNTEMWVSRVEKFTKDTTVREFVERLYKYPGYGMFEGFITLEENVYRFMWGT